MTDPKRLVEETRDPLARSVLRAAHADPAPDAVRERVLLAVESVFAGNPTGMIYTSQAGHGADTPASTPHGKRPVPGLLQQLGQLLGGARGTRLALWGCCATVLAYVAIAARAKLDGVALEPGVSTSLQADPAPASAARVGAANAESPAAPEAVAGPTIAKPRPAERTGKSAPLAKRSAPVSANGRLRQKQLATSPTEPLPSALPSSLAEELRLLSKARKALGAGRSGDALAELHQYEQRFPEGKLRQEAVLLGRQVARALARSSQ